MLGTPWWVWTLFLAFVALMTAVDLVVFQRKAHAISLKEAAAWSGAWIGLALAFNLLVWGWLGPRPALEFLTGYLIEESLSLDNLFVFLVIFQYFSLASKLYRLVLTWGILGAVILRGIMIFAGVALVNRFSFVIGIFGALLLLTAVKLLFQKEERVDPDRNLLVRFARLFYPVVRDFHGTRFWVRRRDGPAAKTPQLVVLIVVSTRKEVFATDSIPAIFAVTRDPFIVFTSNLFAVMGLRSIFFLLAGVLHKFRFLRHGLAAVLGFIGTKMVLEPWLHLSILASLGGVVVLLAGSLAASLLFPATRKGKRP